MPRSPTKVPSDSFLEIKIARASRDNVGDLHLQATTNVKSFSRTSYSVTRTHAEIERLAAYLKTRHPELIVPVPPAKTHDVVLYVKLADTFFKRLCENETLRESEGVKTFFETEFQFTPAMTPALGSGTPPKRRSTFGLFGGSTPRVNDIDPYFEHARAEAEGIEKGFLLLAKVVDKAFRVEKALAVSTLDVSARMTSYANEEPEQISGSLKKLAKQLQLAEVSLAAQSAYTANSFLEYCTNNAKCAQSAQVSIDHRLEILTEYEAACKATQKKITGIEKLKNSSNIKQDKVDLALEELAESKKVEGELRDQLRRLGDVVKEECMVYARRRDEDITRQISEYVTRQIQFNSQILAVLSDKKF